MRLLAFTVLVCLTGGAVRALSPARPEVWMNHVRLEGLARSGAKWDYVQRHLGALEFPINAVGFLISDDDLQRLAAIVKARRIRVAIECGYFDWVSKLEDLEKPSPKGMTDTPRLRVEPGVAGGPERRLADRPIILLAQRGDGDAYRMLGSWSSGTWTGSDERMAEVAIYSAWWTMGEGGGPPRLVTFGVRGFEGWSAPTHGRTWTRSALPGRLADDVFAGQIEDNIDGDVAIDVHGASMIYVSSSGLQHVDLRNGNRELLVRLSRFPGGIRALALAPNGRDAAFTTTGTYRHHPWSDERYEELWTVDVRTKAVRHLGRGARPAWDTSGTRVLALDGPASRGRALVAYTCGTGRRVVLRRAETEAYMSVACGPDGRRLAVWGAYGQAHREEAGAYLTTLRGNVIKVLPVRQTVAEEGPIQLIW
jgi:hypothetical protein